MVKAGHGFEQLIHNLFKTISLGEHLTSLEGPRVFLDGKDGKREFDVVLRSKVAGIEMLTVIECRDYSKKLDVSHVDGFLSKIQDVNANKGVLICRKGFSKKAIRKAKRCGISLYTVPENNADEIASGISQIGFDHPMIISLINDWDVSVSAVIKPNTSFTLHKDSLLRINDLDINDLLVDAVFEKKIKVDLTNCVQKITPYDTNSEPWIRDVKGDVFYLKEAYLNIKINDSSHYFGYQNQLPNSQTMIDIIKDTKRTFFKYDDIILGHYMKHFSKYSKLTDIPQVGALSTNVLSTPTVLKESNGMSFEELIPRG